MHTMRQSVIPTRSTQSSSAAANAKLREKKKEFNAVAALERASGLLVERMEELCADCDIMAEAGTVHGKVLAQWSDMFEILQLFLSTRDQKTGEDEDISSSSAGPGGQLVRIPIEDLQAAVQKESSQS